MHGGKNQSITLFVHYFALQNIPLGLLYNYFLLVTNTSKTFDEQQMQLKRTFFVSVVAMRSSRLRLGVQLSNKMRDPCVLSLPHQNTIMKPKQLSFLFIENCQWLH